MSEKRHIAVIGGGPAGLMAAETALKNGCNVTLFEQKRSVGRKFLVAGKSGLNLTNAMPMDDFVQQYHGSPPMLESITQALQHFTNDDLRAWAADLGIETHAASSGKVFPQEMKAAPLLRRWVIQLKEMGLDLKTQHCLVDFISQNADQTTLLFDTPEGVSMFDHFNAIIFALGGSSWPTTGSDGKWVSLFKNRGESQHIEPLQAANCGWETQRWTDAFLAEAEGQPLKNITVHCANDQRDGELIITRYGLEGGPIYHHGHALRTMLKHQTTPRIHIDFKPSFSEDQLTKKMESAKKNLVREACNRWKLNKGAASLLQHHTGVEALDKQQLAALIKHFPITLTRPRPIDEVISSAGGLQVRDNLELMEKTNIYAAGEMLDWEAPTGGFLLQACFATGRRAGLAATIALK